MFYPEQRNAFSRVVPLNMTTDTIQTCKEEMKKDVMGFEATVDVWIDKSDEIMELFRGFVQLFSVRMATTLRNTMLVALPIHAILWNILDRRRPQMIDNGCTLAKFIPVRCSDERLEDKGGEKAEEMSVYGFMSSLEMTSENGQIILPHAVGWKRRIKVPHEVVVVVVEPLQ